MTDDSISEAWRPLGFQGDAAAGYDALHDGVPIWMAASLWDWIQTQFTSTGISRASFGGNDRYTYFNVKLLRDAERMCRFSAPYEETLLSVGMRTLRSAVEAAHIEIRLVDYLLSRNNRPDASLDRLLLESGSAWRLGTRAGKVALVRRIPEGVQDAAEMVMDRAGHAGERLAQAWEATFGVSPDPSKAYGLAVKSVEDAAAPVVTPADVNATLGKIISTVRDQGSWSLPMTREQSSFPSGSTLVAMMQTLWTGQSDRHGGEQDRIVPITQEAAESAVLLAVPLVQWFGSGLVARR
ncbi:hypothetical protein [Cellulomonas sp. P24]|uniref:hypothetical protein n=1 Tax=Cellulomonas sp. P24 TaxID=2885206 RepID=UPI00216B52AE|nr:hypothetical protein [Cellulomonas sp. P24]MCR6494059.1 hypothetical protein [Cellulomonas sp. P24]